MSFYACMCVLCTLPRLINTFKTCRKSYKINIFLFANTSSKLYSCQICLGKSSIIMEPDVFMMFVALSEHGRKKKKGFSPIFLSHSIHVCSKHFLLFFLPSSYILWSSVLCGQKSNILRLHKIHHCTIFLAWIFPDSFTLVGFDNFLCK